MEKRELDEDEVKFVQLRVDASAWSMVAILELGHIQIKGEIVRIVSRIRREDRQKTR